MDEGRDILALGRVPDRKVANRFQGTGVADAVGQRDRVKKRSSLDKALPLLTTIQMVCFLYVGPLSGESGC